MKQTQIEVATKNSGATQATKVEITAIKDGKKPNRLFGFIKDKFKDRFGNLKNSIKGIPIGKESTGEKNKLEVGGDDMLMDKTTMLLFIAFIESLTKKKILVDDITKELRKNAKIKAFSRAKYFR